MTLSPASSVGFAVQGGAPADVRQWITVDLAGFPGPCRRGYVVAVEPVDRSWAAIELGNQVREIILTELRRQVHVAPDEALGRSLAAANGVVYQRNRELAMNGNDVAPLIGVTAILFDDQTATFAFLPPGQLILVQDTMVYPVPDLESWFPDYKGVNEPWTQAEPLGYTSWTAPHMVQTELRAGDTLVLCTSETGRAYAESLKQSGLGVSDLTWHHRRDPDRVLDSFRDVVIASGLSNAAVAVISFPPLPNNAQIQTLGDVRARARESWRHSRAVIGRLKPGMRATQVHTASATTAAPGQSQPEPAVEPALVDLTSEFPTSTRATPQASIPRRPPTVERGIERLQRVFEGSPDRKAGWRRTAPATTVGVPARSSVSMFRGQTHYMGDTSWRNTMPRLPVIGSAWIWPVLAILLFGLVLGGTWTKDTFFTAHVDTSGALAAIDTLIVDARKAATDEQAAALLEQAQTKIDAARDNGVDGTALDQRQRVLTNQLDKVTDVIRVSDVKRIGALPAEFGDNTVQGVYSPAGVFFVSGSLFQYRPNQQGGTPELVTILSEGDKVGSITVGSLWGVAWDSLGLYVTDGETAFMLPVEAQKWTAVPLGKINDQTWKPGPLAAFDGSLYLLEADGRQIYRFTIDKATGQADPHDWLMTGARDDIQYATDLAIDGRVYVLLEDGTVELMYLGDLKETLAPPYVDGEGARALVGRGSTGYLYVAVAPSAGGEGRIIAFDEKGKNAVQLKLPVGFSTGDANVREPFDGIQEVIVDESTGTIYLINADAIWTARYSLPALPSPPPTATPVS